MITKTQVMKFKGNAIRISIVIAVLHCILGNVIGARSDNIFIQFIFLPYSFIAGMSDFAGWGFLSVVLELVGLIVMTIIFYPVGLLLEKKKDI
jgi:hypothetical protein